MAHLEIVEDGLMSAATSSEETRSTNLSGRRSGRMRKQTQVFDVDQYARSVKTPKSKPGQISLKSTKSVLKNVVQTARREWKNRLSGAPTVVRRDRTISREREGENSLRTRRSRQTEVEVDNGTDAQA